MTGGAGMIGSNLVRRLVGLGCDVFVVDNLWRGSLDNLRDDGREVVDLTSRFFQLDLREPGILEQFDAQFDVVFHLADIVAGIDYVFAHEGDIFRDNILINTNVVSSVKKLQPGGYIYVGTACSFPKSLQNSTQALALREEQLYPAEPESAYGWSKLMGLYEAELLQKETSIKCCNLIFHTVYGAPCDFGPRSQVIPALIRKALRHPDEDFIVWGSGRQGRAFVHVNDVTDALILAMDKGWGAGPIQIGPDRCISIREIAETVVRLSGKPITARFDVSKPEGDMSRCADYSKARRVLGWEPRVTLEQGLQELLDWMRRRIDMPNRS